MPFDFDTVNPVTGGLNISKRGLPQALVQSGIFDNSVGGHEMFLWS